VNDNSQMAQVLLKAIRLSTDFRIFIAFILLMPQLLDAAD